MEAREFEDYEVLTPQRPLTQEYYPNGTLQRPLTQEYHPNLYIERQQRKQQREISFFGHIAAYCFLLSFITLLLLNYLPVLLAVPLGLFLPVGLILTTENIFKHFRNRQNKR